MRLDAAASRALNVLPQRLDGSASFSLYGIMARGKTAMGKRLLKVGARSSTGRYCLIHSCKHVASLNSVSLHNIWQVCSSAPVE